MSKQPLTKAQKLAKLKSMCDGEGCQDLKREIIEYNELRKKLIKDMENHPDPVFQNYLQIYKTSLGPKDFVRYRMKVYAMCNKRAMSHYISLDELLTNKGDALKVISSSSLSSTDDEED